MSDANTATRLYPAPFASPEGAAQVSAFFNRFFSQPAPMLPTRPTWVYFFEGNDGRIKIGVSHDPVARCRAIGTQGGYRGKLLAVAIGNRIDEQALHARFETSREVGEWFVATPALREEIARAATEVPDPVSEVKCAKRAYQQRMLASRTVRQ